VLQRTAPSAYLHALIPDSFEISEAFLGRHFCFRGRHAVASVFLLKHFDVKAQFLIHLARDFSVVQMLQ
jgi:hypothetical protein